MRLYFPTSGRRNAVEYIQFAVGGGGWGVGGGLGGEMTEKDGACLYF